MNDSTKLYTIDWERFHILVRARWHSRYAMQQSLPTIRSGSTQNSLWQGKPVGLIPMLLTCRALGVNPDSFLILWEPN